VRLTVSLKEWSDSRRILFGGSDGALLNDMVGGNGESDKATECRNQGKDGQGWTAGTPRAYSNEQEHDSDECGWETDPDERRNAENEKEKRVNEPDDGSERDPNCCKDQIASVHGVGLEAPNALEMSEREPRCSGEP
jgi:hypothetical protein